MSLIWLNTQEWIRQKFFHIVVFISLALVMLSSLFGSLSFLEQTRITLNIGLSGVELITVFIAAFISTHALQKDIDRRTIQLVLARPVARWKILMGYLGCIKILNYIVAIVLGCVLLVLLGQFEFWLHMIVAIFMIVLKSLVIASFGLFLSTQARPMISFVMSLAFWVLAYSVPDIGFFIKKMNSSLFDSIDQILNFIVPQFYLFNWKDIHFFSAPVPWSAFLWSWFHCVGWIFLLVFFASVVFQKKEIT